jgi:nucleotide-binding universal stress UspA family protein
MAEPTTGDESARRAGPGPHVSGSAPPEAATDRAPRPVVVVGVDRSPASATALRWAADEARLRQARLRVVMAWQLPSIALYPAPFPADVVADGQLAAQRLLAEELDEVLGHDRQGLEVEPVVVDGAAAPVLLDQAAAASLLVVGSRGHGGFTGLLLGSTSSQVVHHAPCPVTVVPHR